MQDGTDAIEPDAPAYAYKPSLMGAAWEFRLAPDAIEWHIGRYQGRTAYTRIARVRLSFRPVTMQTRRFVTEIWPVDSPRILIASSSWKASLSRKAGTRPTAPSSASCIGASSRRARGSCSRPARRPFCTGWAWQCS